LVTEGELKLRMYIWTFKCNRIYIKPLPKFEDFALLTAKTQPYTLLTDPPS